MGFTADIRGPRPTMVRETVGDGRDFFNLRWDEVSKADAAPDTERAVHIPAGTYVHWEDGSVHYYDMGLKEYQEYMEIPENQVDPGVALKRKFRRDSKCCQPGRQPRWILGEGSSRFA